MSETASKIEIFNKILKHMSETAKKIEILYKT